MKNIKNYILATLIVGGLSLGTISASPATAATAIVTQDAVQKTAEVAAKKAAETVQIINFSELSKRTGELAKSGLYWAASNWHISIPAAIAGSIYCWYRYEANLIDKENRHLTNQEMLAVLNDITNIHPSYDANLATSITGELRKSIKMVARTINERQKTPSYSFTYWFMKKCFPNKCFDITRLELVNRMLTAISTGSTDTIGNLKEIASELAPTFITTH